MSRADLTCPACRAPADAGEGVDASSERATPAAGDVTVCASCGELLAFATNPRARRRLLLARATPAQLRKLGPETQIAIRVAQRAVLQAKAGARKPSVFN